ncbi:MAG: ribosome maturation factor RimM [Pseudomonadota bacterium]
MATSDQRILVAVIGAPHGLRGEVRAKTFTEDPIAVGDYGPLSDKSGQAFDVKSVRAAGKGVVLRLKGVDDRDAAEALRGARLFVPRDALPDTALEKDEYFQTDLEGLAARDAQGADYGIVQAVYNFGAGDILELKTPGGKSVMIPFSEAAVQTIDREQGFITLDPVAAGLEDTPDKQSSAGKGR